jgi:hypothetical protein
MNKGNFTLAALFVDFDNIYISLQQQSQHIANQFATNPASWLDWLQEVANGGEKRRILVRKCYLNPESFGRFRPYFIKSAFEVIDCPPLTAQGKTSTDIHLVMDVIDTLDLPTQIEDFIILSGDSDFTPVLLRLRKHNRRTMVVSAGYYMSPAYQSACDILVPQDDFTRYGLGINGQEDDDDDEINQKETANAYQAPKELLNKIAKRLFEDNLSSQGIEASELPKIYLEFQEFKKSDKWLGYQSLLNLTRAIIKTRNDLEITEDDPWHVRRKRTEENTNEDIKKAISSWIKSIVAESSSAVPMSSLAIGVTQKFGEEIRTSKWLGTGTFKELLKQLDLGRLKLSSEIPGYVYDGEKHHVPNIEDIEKETENIEIPSPPIGSFSIRHPELAPLAWKINQLTNVPYLLPEHYTIILGEIVREINEQNGYQWSRTSKTVRDRCLERGVPIARSQVDFILRALYYSKDSLGKEIPMELEKIQSSMIESIMILCRKAQFQISDFEVTMIEKWMGSDL